MPTPPFFLVKTRDRVLAVQAPGIIIITTNTQNLESILFNCREYLRSNASLNDKRDLLLTLVFMRFIGEKFENTQNIMRQECLDNGITDEEVIKSFLDSPSRYKGIAFVPEDARWSTIMEKGATKLNAALDDAIQELENSGDELKGCIRIGLFTSINLNANVIKKSCGRSK